MSQLHHYYSNSDGVLCSLFWMILMRMCWSGMQNVGELFIIKTTASANIKPRVTSSFIYLFSTFFLTTKTTFPQKASENMKISMPSPHCGGFFPLWYLLSLPCVINGLPNHCLQIVALRCLLMRARVVRMFGSPKPQ